MRIGIAVVGLLGHRGVETGNFISGLMQLAEVSSDVEIVFAVEGIEKHLLNATAELGWKVSSFRVELQGQMSPVKKYFFTCSGSSSRQHWLFLFQIPSLL